MIRKSVLAASAAAVAVLALAGLAAAKADGLILKSTPAEPAVYRSDNSPAQDRLLAKAAFTDVLARRASTLGIIPPQDMPAIAPIYPGGMILDIAASAQGNGAKLQYAAAGSLRTVLDFYEDAAALHHAPFVVRPAGPDSLVFEADQGARKVQARLTRQFGQSTVVDLSYD